MTKLLLKIVGLLGGSLLLGILVLILLGVIAWWFIKRKLGGFLDKAVLASMPPAIHLVRERSPEWVDRFEVSERVDALRAHGFVALGTYRVRELDGTQIVALVHPAEGWAAAVVETRNAFAEALDDGDSSPKLHTDLFAHFHDTDERLIASDSEDVATLPEVAGYHRITRPKDDIDTLLKRFRKKVGHHLVRPVRPESFVRALEESYAGEQSLVRETLDLDNLVTTAGPDVPEVERDAAADAACVPVFQALATRDPGALRNALAQAPPLHGRDDSGRTPLMAAVMAGDPSLAQALVQAGADPNAYAAADLDRPFEPRPTMGEVMSQHQDTEGMDPAEKRISAGMQALFGNSTMTVEGALAPLHLAIHGGNGPMVSHLLQLGANPNGIDLDPAPLHFAAERGELDAVGLLLQAGADPNLTVDEGRTPLAVAIERGDGDLVRVLVDGGADVDAKDEDGDTALCLAAHNGEEDIFELLLPHAKKALRKARKLLQENADPESRPEAERLRRAASGDELSRLQRLLAQGIAADAVASSYDRTPLMSAAENGSEHAARLLLQAGANPNHRSEDGETALALAVRPGYVNPDRQSRVTRLLIDAGASLDLLSPEDRAFATQKLGGAPGGGPLGQLPGAAPAPGYPAAPAAAPTAGLPPAQQAPAFGQAAAPPDPAAAPPYFQ